jgi:Zonular occludens toxin (Zot)
MTVYIVTGTLGSGKSLVSVGKIREYLKQGRRVATNLDIYLDKMMPPDSKANLVRVPDKPRLFDMECLGKGCVEADEKKYGLLVLDELGTWMNSRNWRDKGRGDLLDWFRNARKKHWDIYLLVQHIDVVDPQLAKSLGEHLVVCQRTDRVNIPFLSGALRGVGIQQVFPKVHLAYVYYGRSTSATRVGLWSYRGHDLYGSYDTDQEFREETEIDDRGKETDQRATFSQLPPYYMNRVGLELNLKKQLTDLAEWRRRTVAQRPGGASIRKDRLVPYMAVGLIAIVALVGYGILSSEHSLVAPMASIHGVKEAPPAVAKVVSAVKAPTPKKTPAPISEVYVKPVVKKDVRKDIHFPSREVKNDYFSTVKDGASLRISSFWSDGSDVNFIIWLRHGEVKEQFTAADLRAMGWAVFVRKRLIILRKGSDIVRIPT